MDTNFTCSLQNGTLKGGSAEMTCPLDGFELVIFSEGGTGKVVLFYDSSLFSFSRLPTDLSSPHASVSLLTQSYSLCPRCFKDPPFEGTPKDGMACLQCPMPKCRYSVHTNGKFKYVILCPSASPFAARLPGAFLPLSF